MKIQAGQSIWLKYIGSNPRSHSLEPFVVKVKSVGRKYFEVEGNHCRRISLVDMIEDRGDYESRYMAHLSIHEIEDEKELRKNKATIKEKIPEMSLEQTRKVLAIF